jgi:hypothetical protein
MAKLDMQQTFDTVARHLFEQGQPAIKENDKCQYRIGGLKCAIGCLIADKDYDEDLEYHDVCDECVRKVVYRTVNKRVGMKFLIDIQNAHDYARFDWSTMTLKKELRCVAGRYKLSTAVLDTLVMQKPRSIDATLEG